MKNRIQSLLKALSEGVYEKDTELALSLLAAMSGQSILLLGPPGVAKSMVARRLKYSFARARSFEYLMSRFSTPDEIFGPVSISRLKDSDRYERCVDGYLPTADVVFLDEIWKAGPAIQNTLLTVINEKTYLNGQTQLHLPLKLLIGASNELPTEGEGLEALYDRFIVRLVSQPVQREENFYRMLTASSSSEVVGADDKDAEGAFTAGEYSDLQKQIDTVSIPSDVLHAITCIRRALSDVKIEGQDVHRQIYVSDRRWTRIARLLRTSALLHDRSEVSLADLQIAVHCLWSEPDEIPAVSRIVAEGIFSQYLSRLDAMSQSVGRSLRRLRVREAQEAAHARGDRRDDDIVLYDGYYFAIDDRASGLPADAVPSTYIPAVDFRSMPVHRVNEPAIRGVMFNDPQAPKRRVIRPYSNPDNVGADGAELTRVNIYRDNSNIYINGVRYPMRRSSSAAGLNAVSGLEPRSVAPDIPLDQYEQMVDDLFVQANTLHLQLKSHLFVSADVAQTISSRMDSFRRQIAQLRADVRKVVYGE